MVWLVKCVLTVMAGLLFFLQLGHAARKQDRSQLYLLSINIRKCLDPFFEKENVIPLAS
jgi:hypothetical protein